MSKKKVPDVPVGVTGGESSSFAELNSFLEKAEKSAVRRQRGFAKDVTAALNNIRYELSKIEGFKELSTSNASLVAEYKNLRASYDALEKKYEDLQSKYDDLVLGRLSKPSFFRRLLFWRKK